MVVQKTIHLNTTKQFQIFPITTQVEQVLADAKITAGTCTVFVPHSTASVRLNDNEPLLHQDFMKAFYRLIPVDVQYAHDSFENRNQSDPSQRSNGHAHVKAMFSGSSQIIPVVNGKLHLGEHQHIFFLEFDGGRNRQVEVTIMGE